MKSVSLHRWLLCVLGLLISGIGVAVTKRGDMGVSPTSSVGNVLSVKFTAISLGTWLFLWCCLLIVCQVLILRKNFKPVQLVQLPISFLFGKFTDVGMRLTEHIQVNGVVQQLMMVVLGMVILAFGIALSVKANVVLNSGEAFVKALADTTHFSFGNLKIAFDVVSVAASIVLSLVLFHGEVIGTGMGTVISALFTGMIVKLFLKLFSHKGREHREVQPVGA